MLQHQLIEEQALKERAAFFEETEQRRIALENLDIVRARPGVAKKELQRGRAAQR